MVSPFTGVVGHRPLLALLEAQAAAPAQAYLFVGPASVGKATVARRFSALLLCPGAESGCVRRVVAGTHPDLSLVEPDGRTALTVDQARATVARAVLAPIEGDRKVVLFEEAGMMTEEAASALLKTLEEPSPSVTSDRPSHPKKGKVDLGKGEGFCPDLVLFSMGGEKEPAFRLESKDLQGLCDRINQPEVLDFILCVNGQFWSCPAGSWQAESTSHTQSGARENQLSSGRRGSFSFRQPARSGTSICSPSFSSGSNKIHHPPGPPPSPSP